jgi:hypothetical protein
MRATRPATCMRKRKFLARETAEDFVHDLWLRKLIRKGELIPYKCNVCKWWHLTRKRRPTTSALLGEERNK